MERLFIIVLIAGLLIGGYNCSRSTEKTSEEMTIEEVEPEYDPMEKEIMEEGDWIEKQKNALKEGREAEDDIREENID